MVQYILTPWRDRRELLCTRRQFYPAEVASSAAGRGRQSSRCETARSGDARHQAVARVSMWMQRGGCPHLVESTALLTAAILSDAASASADGGGSAGTYAARAAYAAAFSRFVTGLLDGQQDKQRKLSMYSLAKTIGLPATFVELRHQATHEQLPSLAKLRSAARKALTWIWDYYWRHLPDDGVGDDEQECDNSFTGTNASAEPRTNEEKDCGAAVLEYLENGDRDSDVEKRSLVERWGESRLLEALEEISDAPSSNKVMLGALQLSREILQGEVSSGAGRDVEEEDEMRTDTEQAQMESRHDPLDEAESMDAEEEVPSMESPQHQSEGNPTGWSRWQGPWKPKPIGVV